MVFAYKRQITTVLFFYLAVWIFIAYLLQPELDATSDMIENYAWGQTYEWLTYKHPPLLGWVVRMWFTLFPTKSIFYFLLAYLNAIVGIMGILCLANLFFQRVVKHQDIQYSAEKFLWLVFIFTLISAPYSYFAHKFNADTILLSLWPWTTYAFFAGLQAKDKLKKWGWTFGLGILAALSVLGKYYSGVLLLSLFLISLIEKEYRRWYFQPYPYIALLLFISLLLPHLYWVGYFDFPFRHSMAEHIKSDGFSIKQVFSFMLTGIYYLPLSWMIWLLLRYKTKASISRNRTIDQRAVYRPLVPFFILLVFITLLLCYFLQVKPGVRWTIPVWFALPIFMALLLISRLALIEVSMLKRSIKMILLATLLAGIGYALFLSLSGQKKYTVARFQMAAKIESRFQMRYPAQTLSWAGGEWADSPALAFSLSSHPRALPGFPNQMPALVNPHPQWQQQYGVLICSNGKHYNAKGAVNLACIKSTRKWLEENNLPVKEEIIFYSSEGWPYFNAVPKEVTVFWLPPSQLRENL